MDNDVPYMILVVDSQFRSSFNVVWEHGFVSEWRVGLFFFYQRGAVIANGVP